MGPDLANSARMIWHRFLETYEPLRGDLYRYCRHLTKSPWDAEDLAQDTLARAFVTLAQLGTPPPSPRAWLFRVASNRWIDTLRRPPEPELEAGTAAARFDPQLTREAVGTLFVRLPPQERAALVLKDVFELSLEEVADVLATTPGAIKSALHRARDKLATPEPVTLSAPPSPPLIDAFCAAFNVGDLDRLAALLLDTCSAEVVGATTQYGPEAAKATVLSGMLFGVARMAAAETRGGMEARFVQGVRAEPPRVEAVFHRDAWLLVHWYRHDDGDAVRAVTRLVAREGRVALVRNYFFNPDFIADVCAELGLPSRSNGYRWWLDGDCAP